MRVLVTYGSKLGGTEGIAQILGEELRKEGLEVDVVPAAHAGDPAAYDGVVVGGALYAARWHRDAKRFVTRHRKSLRSRPVWFFSSGPLDDSASQHEIPPTPQVRSLMARVGARGHETFGGRLEKDAPGFIAQAMAKKLAGDWRDAERIRAWGHAVGQTILENPPVVPVPAEPAVLLRWPVVALCLFSGLTAMVGGLVLLEAPNGAIIRMPVSALEHSPFSDFTIPGWLLFGVVGLSNAAAGLLQLQRHRFADMAAFIAGGAMTTWIIVEMIMLRTVHWLQMGYLAVGLATLILAFVRLRQSGLPGLSLEPPGGQPVHP